MPEADILVLTWTSAEWRALDHIFLNSAQTSSATDYEWRKAWHPYTRGAADYVAEAASGKLWGEFQLVQVKDQSGRPWRVLLFKSNSHLAHSPWVAGLSAMLRLLFEDVKPDRIYTIGTAGGARLNQHLGDTIITNSALLDVQRPQNISDPEHGMMYRCPSWFPATNLFGSVQQHLLYPMNQLVTRPNLEALFANLKGQYPADVARAAITLEDLLNDAIRPETLAQPTIQALRDVPLLTTDFYYIATGEKADAYAFLEMDDAVIAREANRAGVRFACIRNISDPIVPARTLQGAVIADDVRAGWSALIYTTMGLHTSYNGALATWATLVGEGSNEYNPPRSVQAPLADDPLEVKLAFQVRSCGTCTFFWPEDKQQPYGPYTAFDFDINVPYASTAGAGTWVAGRTRAPAFPNGEVIDGCRKAPIMTIGINPNLTAFALNQTGAAWCYPNFSSDNDTNAWAKYAWYYRYRSVYQERLSLDFIRRFVLPDGQIMAPRNGRIVAAVRPDDSPTWKFSVRYDGDAADTVITAPGQLGDFPYVLLFNSYPPGNVFAAGQLLAGRLAVPEGIQVEIEQQEQGYYTQFAPTLRRFEDTLRTSGHPSAHLQIGEDVCQLDMVACASPHWNADFLGGSSESIATIVDNCLSHNAWALKQMVQTRPAILYIVSKSSWEMFRQSFGAHVTRDKPLSEHPVDNDFTLLRETTDPDHPCYIDFDVTIDGQRYTNRTRLVITPHFSYSSNFLKQFRVPQAEWKLLQQTCANCLLALTAEQGFTIEMPEEKYAYKYVVVQLGAEPVQAAASLAWLQHTFPAAYQALIPYLYDPHTLMGSVLDQLYAQGKLNWHAKSDGTGYLARTEGSCQFCVNQHWQFPNECRYDKPKEPAPAPGFLEKVADYLVATGRPASVTTPLLPVL